MRVPNKKKYKMAIMTSSISNFEKCRPRKYLSDHFQKISSKSTDPFEQESFHTHTHTRTHTHTHRRTHTHTHTHTHGSIATYSVKMTSYINIFASSFLSAIHLFYVQTYQKVQSMFAEDIENSTYANLCVCKTRTFYASSVS